MEEGSVHHLEENLSGRVTLVEHAQLLEEVVFYAFQSNSDNRMLSDISRGVLLMQPGSRPIAMRVDPARNVRVVFVGHLSRTSIVIGLSSAKHPGFSLTSSMKKNMISVPMMSWIAVTQNTQFFPIASLTNFELAFALFER